MFRHSAYLAISLLPLLASCGLPPEQQAAADHLADQQRCSGFGFTSGTDGFANCMMTTDQNGKAQEAASNRAALARKAADDRVCTARVLALNPPSASDDPLRASILLNGQKVMAGCS
jgi:hypothetical protein